MKIQASSAIENGFTSQLTPTVEAMPRQCCPTSREGREIDLEQHRDIMSQTSTATGILTCATVASPRRKDARQHWPSAMPAMMQSATQKVRKRSNTPMAGFAAPPRGRPWQRLMTAILCFRRAGKRGGSAKPLAMYAVIQTRRSGLAGIALR